MTSPPDRTLRIVHLYPEHMNIYGDWGNVLALQRRAEWHGFEPTVIPYHPGAPFPRDVDIIVGGGGQDSGQGKIQADLLAVGDDLHFLADDGVPMLVVCGLFQLFGHFFETSAGERLKGIGIFDAATYAGPKRLVGNVVTASDFGDLIGYENHSGLTTLGSGQPALGRVTKGAGNNGTDKTEGATYNCVFGTYLHGSVLPRNPRFADALVEAAAVRRYGSFLPVQIDDTFADRARAVARQRPR